MPSLAVTPQLRRGVRRKEAWDRMAQGKGDIMLT